MPSLDFLILTIPTAFVVGFLLLPRKLRIAIDITIGRK